MSKFTKCSCFDGYGKCHDPYCKIHGFNIGVIVNGKKIEKYPAVLIKKELSDKLISSIDKIEVKNNGSLAIHLNRPIEIVCSGDLLFTLKGELGILAEDKICLDSKEVHLNSRNCKQISEMEETILKVLLNKIGVPETIDHNKIEQVKFEFKEQIKKEIKEELLKEILLKEKHGDNG
jgi:hypothetical protein